jgi:hypothetical protein
LYFQFVRIGEFLSSEDLGEETGFQVFPESRFMDQGGQVVGIGLLEAGIIGIKALHRPLQRAPGVEATGPSGAVDILLGFAGSFVQIK